MRLQIASQLAIYALLELAADPDRKLSVGEIGEKYGVSNHHLAKVMNVLGRAKLVRSARGVGGGYHFSGNARRTTLLDVIELFENFSGGRSDGSTAGTLNRTTGEGRALAQILQEIDDIARATLGSITIATMLKIVERHRGGSPAC
jgi:Rrf2 family transcriptional regulator, nitric oxide-sensitive transcriptional repressor